MEINNENLKKNVLYNTVGSIYYLATQWLITVLVVRLASYSEAGMLSLAISITNIFHAISLFGMRSYQLSDYNDRFSSEEYIKSRIVTSVCSFIFCTVFVLCNRTYDAEQMMVIVIYMVFRVIEALIDVIQGIQQKNDRVDYIAVSCFMRGTVSLIAFVICMILTKSLIISVSAMCISTAFVLFLYDWPKCLRFENYIRRWKKNNLWILLKDCLPLTLGTIFITLLVSVPRYNLESLYGKEILGIYSSVATPTVIIQAACTMIFNPLIGKMTEYYVNSEGKKFVGMLLKSMLFFAGFLAIAIIGCTLCGEFVYKIMFGEEIVAYMYLLNPIIYTTFLIALIYFLGIVLTVMRRLKVQVVCSGVAALVIFLVSSEIIRKYDMQGVNYAIYIGTGLDIIMLLSVILYDIKIKLIK